MGVQFDGYCSTVATTIVVGAKGPVSGSKADAIKAAETALEATLRLIRPGNKVCKFWQLLVTVVTKFFFVDLH